MPRYDPAEVFTDRSHAGAELAALLEPLRGENPVVVALPRGGVAVGYEVARALGAPLDVLVARKVGAPGHPELGVAAVAPGGILVVEEQVAAHVGLTREAIARMAESEVREMDRREALYRRGRAPLDVTGRTVALVDDGLATGITARAALAALRARTPRHITLAVPVCAADTAAALRREADALVSVITVDELYAVGAWYRDFRQMSDEQVIWTLDAAEGERA